MNRNHSNRDKSIMANSLNADLTMICRIVREEKAIFKEDIGLQEGDIIKDINTQARYRVKGLKTRNHSRKQFEFVKYPIERERL